MRASFLFILVLAGCGDGGKPEPQSSSPNQPIPVTVVKSSNGCLVNHNADAVASYMLGTHRAQTLLWNCASIGTIKRASVESFYTFDDALQCFVELSVADRSVADCARPATAPSTPALSADIIMLSTPALVSIGGGAYALQPLDVDVDMTGNLTGFGLTLELSSTPAHFAAVRQVGGEPISGLRYLLPEQTELHRFVPPVSHLTSPGDAYRFVLTVKDNFGNPIGSTSFMLTAP